MNLVVIKKLRLLKAIYKIILGLFLSCFCCASLFAQEIANKLDTTYIKDLDKSNNRDLIDLIHHWSKKHEHPHGAAREEKADKYNLSVVPALGYTLQTGFAGILSFNVGYYNDEGPDAKISSFSSSVTYSQYNQVIVPVFMDIWSKGGKFNFISDNRYISYPSDIYGLGGRTDPNRGHTIDFNGLKMHETLLAKVGKNLYAGVGLYYDQFWDIKVINPVTRRIDSIIQKELGNKEFAFGPAFKLLYDSRTNQINPDKGNFLNLVLRNSAEFLGSDNTWSSLLIDARKYITFPRRSKNTLALWSYNWLTVDGTPPYLLLPSTGWDDQYNTGRGYIQSRFRGKQMVYFETEYRYQITRNGLIGGVLFFNMQHFSGDLSQTYNAILPGYGLGIRIKLNKHSGANLCLDYGFGNNGSGGFYVNLGEVF